MAADHRSNLIAFAPTSFSAGKKPGSHYGLAVLSCRYPKRGWTQLGRFKSIVGYSPGQQRDPEAELAKAVSGGVVQIENKPMTGFKLVSPDHTADGHALLGSWAADVRAVDELASFLVADPRGFSVAVRAEAFWRLLEASGGSLDGYAFRCEAAYIWRDQSSCPELVPAESETWKLAWAKSRRDEEAEAKRKWTKPSELVPGKLYLAEKPGIGGEAKTSNCFYLGKLEVYTHLARSMAIRSGKWLDSSQLAVAKRQLLRTAYGAKRAEIASREQIAGSGSSFVFSEAASSLSRSWQQPKFWTASSISKLLPVDRQAQLDPVSLEPAVKSLESGCFKRYRVSREAMARARWKRLEDVDLLATAIQAACGFQLLSSHYARWWSQMAGRADSAAAGSEMAACKQALAAVWPMLPGMAFVSGSYGLASCTVQTQVFKTKLGFGPTTISRAAKWQATLYGLPAPLGVALAEPSYCGTRGSPGSLQIAWRREACTIRKLAELAIAELEIEIPEIEYEDRHPVPDHEAMWFAAEVAEAAGLAKTSWKVPAGS